MIRLRLFPSLDILDFSYCRSYDLAVLFTLCLYGASALGATFPVRKAGALRVMSYNVKKGNAAADIAKDLKHYRADVILLQEVDDKTKRSGGEDQVALLKKSLQLFGFYAASYSVDGGTTGQAILSRFPLKNAALIKLSKSRNIGAVAHIRWRGRDVTLITTHFSSTYKVSLTHVAEAAKARLREAKHLASLVLKTKGIVILGGDFNCFPGSEPYESVKKQLEPVSKDEPTLPTVFPALKFDHIFASKLLKSSARWIGHRGCSDHLPVISDLSLVQELKAYPNVAPPLKVITWNIQYGRNAGVNKNRWPERKNLLVKVLQKKNPDIFCGQEVLRDQLMDLKKALPKHDVIATGRDDGKEKGEHCPVFFNSKKLKKLDSGTFWLSATPHIPSKTWGNKYKRICTWVLFETIPDGRKLCVWNTHFPLNVGQRLKASRLIAQKIESEPFRANLLLGDFNEIQGSDAFPAFMRTGLYDCYALAKKPVGHATFRLKGFGVARIDWIMATPDWKIDSYRTLDTKEKGIHPSDHNGVLIVLKWQQPTERITIITATGIPGEELVIEPNLEKLKSKGLSLASFRKACMGKRFFSSSRIFKLGNEKFKLKDFATLHTRRMKAKVFKVKLSDGRKAVITPDVAKIGAYLVPMWYFEQQVRQKLCSLSLEVDPQTVVLLSGIPVPGGQVPNVVGKDHIHISTGVPLTDLATVLVKGK